jgi:hypothetical protein
VVQNFYDTLKGLEGVIYDRLKPGALMNLSHKEEEEFEKTNICYCCKQNFKKFPKVDKNRDHDHKTG